MIDVMIGAVISIRPMLYTNMNNVDDPELRQCDCGMMFVIILDWHCVDGCALMMSIPTSIVILKILVMLMAMAAVFEMLMLIAIEMTMLLVMLMMSTAIAVFFRQVDLRTVFANILYLK